MLETPVLSWLLMLLVLFVVGVAAVMALDKGD